MVDAMRLKSCSNLISPLRCVVAVFISVPWLLLLPIFPVALCLSLVQRTIFLCVSWVVFSICVVVAESLALLQRKLQAEGAVLGLRCFWVGFLEV
jgi:hypothetical protein